MVAVGVFPHGVVVVNHQGEAGGSGHVDVSGGVARRQHLCVPGTSSTSCDQAIFVDHAIDASVSSDAVSTCANNLKVSNDSARDGHVSAAEQPPRLHEHVGHLAAVLVYDKSLDVPDIAVDEIDGVAAAHRHLSRRKDVIGEGLGQAAVNAGPGRDRNCA